MRPTVSTGKLPSSPTPRPHLSSNDKVDDGRRTERILCGEGNELLHVGHQNARLERVSVRFMLTLLLNDINFKVNVDLS